MTYFYIIYVVKTHKHITYPQVNLQSVYLSSGVIQWTDAIAGRSGLSSSSDPSVPIHTSPWDREKEHSFWIKSGLQHQINTTHKKHCGDLLRTGLLSQSILCMYKPPQYYQCPKQYSNITTLSYPVAPHLFVVCNVSWRLGLRCVAWLNWVCSAALPSDSLESLHEPLALE